MLGSASLTVDKTSRRDIRSTWFYVISDVGIAEFSHSKIKACAVYMHSCSVSKFLPLKLRVLGMTE